MKAILFAVLIFAIAPASGTAQRMSGDSCARFDCTAYTEVTVGEMVNRNGKGDRLPALHQIAAKQPVETLNTFLRDQELAEGCESLASSLSRSSLANIAGRCLS